MKNIIIASMIGLAGLTGCKEEITQGIRANNDSTSDSLCDTLQSNENKIKPLLKMPKMNYITKKDCQNGGVFKDKDSFLKMLQNKTNNNVTLIMEGGKMHQLYQDSLILYNLYNNDNKEFIESVDKKTKTFKGGIGLTSKNEEQKLHDWFINYIETLGKNTEFKSQIRNGTIYKENLGNVTLYHTSSNNKYPGIIAKHKTIKPTHHNYFWPGFAKTQRDIFNAAEYLNDHYAKPQQKIIVLPKEIGAQYGLYSDNDIQEAIKTHGSNTNTTTTNTNNNKTKEELIITTQQKYVIPTNGDNQLVIRDHQEFDNDSIKIINQTGENNFAINNQKQIIDITIFPQKKIYIELTSQGTIGLTTFAFSIGNHMQEIIGKKGEVVLLEFQ